MPIKIINPSDLYQIQKVEVLPETFEQALNHLKQAMLQAYRKGNKGYAIAHASKIEEKILRMHREIRQAYSSTTIQDAWLIEHLNNTAVLLSADEDELEKIQNYIKSAKALYPTDTAMKSPLLAYAGASIVIGIALMATGIGAHMGFVLVATSVPVALHGAALFYKSLIQEEELFKSAKKLCRKDGRRVRVSLSIKVAS